MAFPENAWIAVRAILGAAAGAAAASALSTVVGMTLLYIPFSFPLAVVLAVIMVVLGLHVVFSPAVRGTGQIQDVPWIERVIVSAIAVFALAGGAFAIALNLKLRDIAPVGRVAMFAVLGTALTIVIVINIIDLVEILAACCGRGSSAFHGGSFAYRAPARLLPRPAQIYTLVLTGLLLGMLDGVLFGMVGVAEAAKAGAAPPSAQYSPWPATRKYSAYWLPASAALGALGVLVALTCLAPAPLPESLRGLREGEGTGLYSGGGSAAFDARDARGLYSRVPPERMARGSWTSGGAPAK